MYDIGKYKKSIVAFVVGVLQVLMVYISVAGDGFMTASDWQVVVSATIVALGGTVGVYVARNK